MKVIKRRIVMLVTDDESYVINEVVHGFIVRDIVFRRDGQLGVNRSNTGDDAHYVVFFINETNEKEGYMEYIPNRTMRKIKCVEIEEEVDDDKIEVKKG